MRPFLSNVRFAPHSETHDIPKRALFRNGRNIYKVIIYFSLKFLWIHSDPNHEEALGAMFGSGSLRQLQGLVLKDSTSFKVLFIYYIIHRELNSIHFPLIFYISQILGSVSKGCPLLEYIDVAVDDWEGPLHDDVLSALSSLRSLRSVFIDLHVWRKMTPKDGEDFRVSFDAIVDQGLLEVWIWMTARSYVNKNFLPPLLLSL